MKWKDEVREGFYVRRSPDRGTRRCECGTLFRFEGREDTGKCSACSGRSLIAMNESLLRRAAEYEAAMLEAIRQDEARTMARLEAAMIEALEENNRRDAERNEPSRVVALNRRLR